MQVYTKILIGMLVGAVIGLLLGPNSALLPADTYKVGQWDRLRVRATPTSSIVPLPMAPRSGGRPVPLRLEIIKTQVGEKVDASGTPHEVVVASQVRLEMNAQLSLLDRDGAIRGQLGDIDVGDKVDVWIEHEHTALKNGGFASWPVPVSGLGDTIITWLRPLGDIFMRLIKMVIVPLVFASLLVGVASLGDVRRLGRLGVRTVGLYMATTAGAVSLGLLCAHLIGPGSFIDEQSRTSLQAQFQSDAASRVDRAAEAPSTIDNILNIIPSNPVASLVSGDMLQVIFFAVLFGIALTFLPRKQAEPVVRVMDSVQNAMVVIIHIVMKFAPYGVAALIAEVVGTSGFSVLGGLAVYSVTVLIGLGLHGALVYGSIVRYVARLPVMGFLKAIRPAQLIAFSTSSSSAALPVTMECAEQNLNVSNPVASFVLPLGSTINMDGTALYQGVAAMFIAQVFQMDLTLSDQLVIVLTATMASVGAAGVPGAGMVTLAMVLTATGIPTVGVALILGVDRILDMFRTGLNVTGDLSVTAAMARGEGDNLRVLTPSEDQANPERGFEGRLDKDPTPIETKKD